MIAGFYKCSYVDYPEELSSVIFLAGCNFKCPWCHNQAIVKGENSLENNDIVTTLINNKHLINHVVITGGEPTLHGDNLLKLLKQLKANGFQVKLDTNGTNPDLLKEIIKLHLVDYIAMDIKNIWDKYELTTGVTVDTNLIKESIKLIEENGIAYQFRTTCNKEMHTIEDINEIKGYISDQTKYKLQNYHYSKEQLVDNNFGSVDYIKRDN